MDVFINLILMLRKNEPFNFMMGGNNTCLSGGPWNSQPGGLEDLCPLIGVVFPRPDGYGKAHIRLPLDKAGWVRSMVAVVSQFIQVLLAPVGNNPQPRSRNNNNKFHG